MRNALSLSGVALLVVMTMSSCKKEYSCECTKIYRNGNNSVLTKESVRVYKDNKKRATERCSKNESSGTYLGATYSVNCAIK